MILERKLRSLILNTIFHPRYISVKKSLVELRRKFAGQAHVVSVFLQVDDPYSYILSQYLPQLAEQYDIELRLYLSEARGNEYQPAPNLLAEYAVTDCARLANDLGIPFLDKGSLPPSEHRVGLSDAMASLVTHDDFAAQLTRALAAYWRGDSAEAAHISDTPDAKGKARAVIKASQELQSKLGHYSSAMLHYGGEWYWGVDRLHYLMHRLDDLGVARNESPNPKLASIRQAMQFSLPVRPPAAAQELPPIELFFSLRSPYSYLALQRSYDIADAFGLKLMLRPVMPMVMRGMKVPRLKLLYIVLDTVREARRLNIPFGKIADPVGPGVERFMAVHQYAETQHRARDYLLNAATAIWSEATDLATDNGMRKVTGRTGLFWPDVEEAMKNADWQNTLEVNRESMMDSGSWGVPTLRMGDFWVWGQDRDWMLVRHIEDLCDTGDGIIV
jgi:2-hydroxychromene-2-carboxylate isomerase